MGIETDALDNLSAASVRRSKGVKVFMSWSGGLSREVARALREWLPIVVQHVEPWMSEEDIGSGARWNEQVAAELEQTDFGIICLTAANLERPWLLFEAGALAKRLDVARVVPLCIDLKPSDVTMPLASFQGRALSHEGMLRLVRDMNAARDQPLLSQQIDQLVTIAWPMLNDRISGALLENPSDDGGRVRRKTEDVMGELVEAVRRMERRMDTLPSEVDRVVNRPVQPQDWAVGEMAQNPLRADDDEILTTEQVAELLGVSVQTIYSWSQTKVPPDRPPHYAIGRHNRYKKSEVLAWFDAHREDV
jgi:excisionase family DNA binding protein